MSDLRIEPPQTEADQAWLVDLWRQEWGGEIMVSRGKSYRLQELAALIAWQGAERVGLATYYIHGQNCELMSLNAVARGYGVGSALLAATEAQARRNGCTRLWMITSNDNIDAVKFYQRQGYRLVAVHLGAIDEARQVKPSIPLTGFFDIPIHDEWELSKGL